MIKKILIGFGLFVVLVAAVGLMLPSTAQVHRTVVIAAPAATVFTVLDGYRQFQRWSPWADIDPNATTTFEGPPVGVGAKMSWSGNDDVGSGSQEIVESTPYSTIRQRLTFGDFAGDFGASFDLRPVAGGTEVRWEFVADYGGSLVGRYFGLLSDSMLGPDYEKGLGRLKVLVESLPKEDFSALAFATVEAAAVPVVLTSVRSADEPNAIGVALGVAYGRLSGHINQQGLAQVAPPVAIFRGNENGALAIDAAIPVDRADAPTGEGIVAGQLPAGRAVRAEYRGDTRGLAAARSQVLAYLAAAGLEAAGPMWEQYLGAPAGTPDVPPVTHIFSPVR